MLSSARELSEVMPRWIHLSLVVALSFVEFLISSDVRGSSDIYVDTSIYYNNNIGLTIDRQPAPRDVATLYRANSDRKRGSTKLALLSSTHYLRSAGHFTYDDQHITINALPTFHTLN